MLAQPGRETVLSEMPFIIGTTPDGEKWWCNPSLAGMSGHLSDQKLLAMSDADLRRLAYNADGEVRSEKYKRPTEKSVVDRQGGYAGEEYDGVCRAKLILDFREELKRQSPR